MRDRPGRCLSPTMTFKLTTSFGERFAPRINHGGKPFWSAIEYRAEPSEASLQVRVAPTADYPTRPWLPHGRGATLELASREPEPVAFALDILRIHEHPVYTDVRACRA